MKKGRAKNGQCLPFIRGFLGQKLAACTRRHLRSMLPSSGGSATEMKKKNLTNSLRPLAVESSIAVEHAVKNRGLNRVFVLCSFKRVLDTIAPRSRG